MFKRKGFDVVMRLHQARKTGTGRVHWCKPQGQGPSEQALWQEWPKSLELRVVRSHVEIPGFRTEQIALVTTLLDEVAYPDSVLADLFRRRRQVERFFRDIKTTLGLDVPRAFAPLPPRPNRSEPRAIKRRPKSCRLLTKPRREVSVSASRRQKPAINPLNQAPFPFDAFSSDMNLSRFLDAQKSVYADALSELRAGQKRTHWIWFILPQLGSLGHSYDATCYGVENAAEAAVYLAHPVLGARLRECVTAILAHKNKPPTRSSALRMT